MLGMDNGLEGSLLVLVLHYHSSHGEWWYHLISNSLRRHHWSRELILSASFLVTAQHSELYRKNGGMQVLYSINLVVTFVTSKSGCQGFA